ncbi:MAG: UvrD-helicase domain-containing protein [Candidatus Elulimicrobiales bacterium]|nr:UvrD-helicase domain-containing protein [Candidatus Elulimicrobiales bacterium]
MEKILLNEKQLEAVQTTKGPLLILAGAGAGKTKTITERVVKIIKDGVEPKNILCVTFTNKAAKEMLERVLSRLNEENLIEKYEKNIWLNQNLPTIKTFHSLGLSILRQFGKEFGFTKNLTVLDTSDTNQVIKSLLNELGLDPKLHDATKIRNAISREKTSWQTVDDYAKKVSSYNMEIIEKVWRLYEKELIKQGSVDFDDLIIKTIELFKTNSEAKKYYQDKFRYIHIDEYQDTNNSQYELIKELLNTEEKNICVVGDIDQNIYSWRGANLRNILNFEKDFPDGKVVLLEENYRSTKNILDLANVSIQKNKARFPKNLFTNKSTGDEIEICPTFDEKAEADFIVQKIKELVREKGVDLKDIAVLFRTNFQSRILEEYFIKNNIAYNLLGTKFFERKEIKDVMSYLRVSLNRNNLADLKRVFETPKRGIGKASIAKVFAGDMSSISASTLQKIHSLYEFLDKIKDDIENNRKNLSEIIMSIIKDSGIEEELLNGSSEDKERLENVRELVTITKKFDDLPSFEAFEIFIDETSLKSDQDEEGAKDGVRLMTIHAAKGLEFDYVFVAGLEQDLFPHIDIGNSKKSLEETEEERRLFYVAITRAKKKLYLCFAEMRTIYGEKRINIPSEFLEDVNELKEEQVIYHDIYYQSDPETNFFKPKKKNWEFADDEWEEDFLEI